MTSEAAITPSKSRLQNPGYRDFYWLRSFVAGGVASCCAKTTIAPLDRVKILLQAQNVHYRHLGVLATVFAVKKNEGFLGLYKGNGAMMVRIFPYGAIQFMAFDKYKKVGFIIHCLYPRTEVTALMCPPTVLSTREAIAMMYKHNHR